MQVHLVNPSDISFGTAVITPRWLYVLAASTPERFGTPIIVDETLEPFDVDAIRAGDVVGIGIHTANALRGYQLGQRARARGALVVFGGIHATLFPDEVREHGGAHAVVCGDGDLIWPDVLADCELGAPKHQYDGGRIEGDVTHGVLPCGQSAGLIERIEHAAAVVENIAQQAAEVLSRLPRAMTAERRTTA